MSEIELNWRNTNKDGVESMHSEGYSNVFEIIYFGERYYLYNKKREIGRFKLLRGAKIVAQLIENE